MNENNALSLIPDTPNENAFREYVQPLAEFILNSEPRLTIGVFGGWGVGKTSFLKSLKAELKSKDNVIVVFFNAWRYELEKTHATIPLLKSIYFAFDEYYKKNPSTSGERIREALKTLIQHFNVRLYLPLGIGQIEASLDRDESEISKLTALFGDSTIYYDAVKYLELAIKKLRDEVKDFRIVVLVDDLDRCHPKKAVEVLESIKVLLDIEGFIYVIALNHVVMKRLLASYYNQNQLEDRFSEDYFSKFFQVTVSIPEWDGKRIKEEVLDILKKHTPLKEGHLDRIITALERKLTPREAKKFANTFIIRLEIAKSVLKDLDIDEHTLSELILDLCILESDPKWARILRLIERYGETEFRILKELVTFGEPMNQEDLDKVLSSKIGEYLTENNLIVLSEEDSSPVDYSQSLERLIEVFRDSLLFSSEISYETISHILKIQTISGDIGKNQDQLEVTSEIFPNVSPNEFFGESSESSFDIMKLLKQIHRMEFTARRYRSESIIDEPIQIACVERVWRIFSLLDQAIGRKMWFRIKRKYSLSMSYKEYLNNLGRAVASKYATELNNIIAITGEILQKIQNNEKLTKNDFETLNTLYKEVKELIQQMEADIYREAEVILTKELKYVQSTLFEG